MHHFDFELEDSGELSEAPSASRSLPRLLAGPILRRAEPKGVWVWFALSQKPVAVEPRVVPYHADGSPNAAYARSGSFPLATVSTEDVRTIQVAPKLWVLLVRLRPASGAFPRDQLLGYTFRFRVLNAAGVEQSFWLQDEVPGLSYRPFELPTFFLSSTPRRIVQGSCRRPGATGQDAHDALDALFAQSATAIQQRPYALFLTGDQIYADDVAEALFDATGSLARDLFGYSEEVLTGGGKTATSDTLRFGTTRRDFVRKTLGFTTSDGHGHLLSFSEFSAMYLLVWGPGAYGAYDIEKRRDILATKDGANLVGFGASISAARRVMANVPVYMIFDDHEVTDDWYMDDAWIRATNSDPAKLVIANGLLAYWVFQAWGNDPDGLEPMRNRVRLAIEHRWRARGAYRPDDKKPVTWISSTHPWSFVPPIVPQTLVVNTRTRRQYPTKSPPILVGLQEIARLKQLAKDAAFVRGNLLLLVVATPLFNLPVVEAAATINTLRGKSRYDDDHELFTDKPGARDYFLDQLQADLAPDSMVAFSGDVHHSFAIQAKLDVFDAKGKPRRIELLQITSSPIKNFSSNFEGKLGTLADTGEEVLHDDSVVDFDILPDARLAAVEYQPLSLSGKLGHHTFIPNNNFCIVDFKNAPAKLDVGYVGMSGKTIQTATRNLKLRPDELTFELAMGAS